jgi:hypothetical protein
MADYVIPGGQFTAAVDLLLQGEFAITWYDRHAPPAPLHSVDSNALSTCIAPAALTVPALPSGVVPQRPQHAPTSNRSNREKYTCPQEECRVNVWGKPGLRVACIEHGRQLIVDAREKTEN